MDLERICLVLKATQCSETEARKEAEKQLDDAVKGTPDQLTLALSAVLAAPIEQVDEATRQEAAVIFRQLVDRSVHKTDILQSIQAPTKQDMKAQLLKSLESDSSSAVRRSVGLAITAVANNICLKADSPAKVLQKEWPELMPLIARCTNGNEVITRVAGFKILKDLTPLIGDMMMENWPQLLALLTSALCCSEADVKVAGADVAFHLIMYRDLLTNPSQLGEVMPAVVAAIQSLANPLNEDQLKQLLMSLVEAVEIEDEEENPAADILKEANVVKDLSETLLKIASAGPETFSTNEVRASAMEAMVSIANSLDQDVAQPEGQPLLEHLVRLNLTWMLEVEENVDEWTKAGEDEAKEDGDEEVVGYAEEHIDSLAQYFDESVLMPIIFTAIRSALQHPDCTWKSVRASLSILGQVVEHLEDEAWMDQMMDFCIQYVAHDHPRVRHRAWKAICLAASDQAEHIGPSYFDSCVPLCLQGINDSNLRVATAAIETFAQLGEDTDADQFEPYGDELMLSIMNRLQAGESSHMQECCLDAIAVIAEAMEDEFEVYYSQIMPMLKQVLGKSPTEEERPLHGKVWSCISLIGSVVGKEKFLPDAIEVMQSIVPVAQAGFAADDPRRESFTEAVGQIAEALEKDFKPFAAAILPIVFKAIQQKPMEGESSDEEGEYDDLLGLRTSITEEIESYLDLADSIMEALEDEFIEFLPVMTENLLPLMSLSQRSTLRAKIFESWECLVGTARICVDCGKLDIAVLRGVVDEFLKSCLAAMAAVPASAEQVAKRNGVLNEKAAGVAGVIKKAGKDVLSKGSIQDLSTAVAKFIENFAANSEGLAIEPGVRERRGGIVVDEDSDGDDKYEEEDEYEITLQTVRFSLCDVVGAMMRCNADDFAEVGLPMFMTVVQALVRPERPDSDKALGFYLADDLVSTMGPKSVPFWNGFMNEAITCMTSATPIVRQFATSTIGKGSAQPAFAQVVPIATQVLDKVLTKQAERHRRRRAVKKADRQNALAVDACIASLGQICKNHEAQLGAHAGITWQLWLANLPLKYNEDACKVSHTQLVDMVVANHPVIIAPEVLPRVMAILADIYKATSSSSDLDKKIATAVSNVGEDALETLKSSLTEKRQKKVDQMRKACRAGA